MSPSHRKINHVFRGTLHRNTQIPHLQEASGVLSMK
jgi:hypothetical protein